MNNTTTDLAQRIAELPPKPEAFDIWHETDDDCGAWARPSRPVYEGKQMDAYALAAQAPLLERIKELERQPVKLGVVEFHTPKNAELIRQFYEVTNDLKMAGCIVDLWLMDIATVLKRHGYSMEIYKDTASSQGQQRGEQT